MPFDIVEKYSWYIEIVYFTTFNIYLCPLLLALTFAAIFFLYWVDKFNLFKRMSLKSTTNSEVAAVGVKLLHLSLLVSSVGYLIESFLIRSTPSVLIEVAVGIEAAFALFVVLGGINLLGKVDTLKLLYDNCLSSGKFRDTYWNLNPVTTLIH